eukprot:3494553-Prorocentrum_lima.AAC.1
MEKLRKRAREIATMVALIPGHKLVACGGSAEAWQVGPLYDHYSSMVRHWMVESFDHFERGGWESRTIV